MKKIKINLLIDLLKKTNIDEYISYDELSEIDGLELIGEYEQLTNVHITAKGRKVIISALSGSIALLFDNVKNKKNYINIVVCPISNTIILYDMRRKDEKRESYLEITNKKYRQDIVGESFSFKNFIEYFDIELSTVDVKDKIQQKKLKGEKMSNKNLMLDLLRKTNIDEYIPFTELEAINELELKPNSFYKINYIDENGKPKDLGLDLDDSGKKVTINFMSDKLKNTSRSVYLYSDTELKNIKIREDSKLLQNGGSYLDIDVTGNKEGNNYYVSFKVKEKEDIFESEC